ncbi:hypothetical protein [Flavobacterium beibuense]|uniref:Uncharacterized protein n=1 Tax=Flavobacterium beibuense TaxID=657326 RepID=A0A444W8L7_9FLAO|nr:hypothetical protein [Flavobacterium beibuense]RYJ42092.1 hypothetical protein NU09_2496 [Flavobacterium beibuense]
MKLKILLVTEIVFFLLVNTAYFWEGNLSYWAFPIFIFEMITFFTLVIILIWQLVLIVKEKLANRLRNITVLVLLFVITLTIYKPFGLIDFEKWEGEDVMVAHYEGVANGGTTIRLKNNGFYFVKEVYFGLRKYSGQYRLSNDTVFFNHNKNDKGVVLKYGVFSEKSFLATFSKNDSISISLPFRVIKNNLNSSN